MGASPTFPTVRIDEVWICKMDFTLPDGHTHINMGEIIWVIMRQSMQRQFTRRYESADGSWTSPMVVMKEINIYTAKFERWKYDNYKFMISETDLHNNFRKFA